MTKPNMTPLEGAEQAWLFSWAAMQEWRWPVLKRMYHIPNGGKRSKSEAGRFKAEGVKSGVPDIHLPAPRGGYCGLYIELKRLQDGTVSEPQKEWIRELRAEGYAVEVCKGWKAASEIITAYLTEKYIPLWAEKPGKPKLTPAEKYLKELE